ncbi:MAG: hypothetical protein ABIZ80_16900, partial [Bryobacteraceae bacterium]
VLPSGKTETRQWTIDPKDGQPRGFAFAVSRQQGTILASESLIHRLRCVLEFARVGAVPRSSSRAAAAGLPSCKPP